MMMDVDMMAAMTTTTMYAETVVDTIADAAAATSTSSSLINDEDNPFIISPNEEMTMEGVIGTESQSHEQKTKSTLKHPNHDTAFQRPRNLTDYLHQRELTSGRPGSAAVRRRQVHTFIHPNKTLHNVLAPPNAFRKFSPDGKVCVNSPLIGYQYLIHDEKLLITFARNQHAIQIFRFNGSTSYASSGLSEQASQSQSSNPLFQFDHSHSSQIFDSFFTLCLDLTLTSGSEVLCRDFCLFTDDGRHMILASALPSSGQVSAQKYPHSLNVFKTLDDITFWLINLETGMVSDKLAFPTDYIILNQHGGVQLYDDILAITSVQNQTIHFIHVKSSGRFIPSRNVGWHNNDDDELPLANYRHREEKYQQEFMAAVESEISTLAGSSSMDVDNPSEINWLNSAWSNGGNGNNSVGHGNNIATGNNGGGGPGLNPSGVPLDFANTPWPGFPPDFFDGGIRGLAGRNDISMYVRPQQLYHGLPEPVPFMSGLKQRLMSFLYRQALASGKPTSLRHFHLTFSQFSSLVLWRMQFLDENHILIKFGSIENIIGR
ncbi:hypothetical protein HDU76_003659, partial [Blyttiomyces sp. JEL0837]